MPVSPKACTWSAMVVASAQACAWSWPSASAVELPVAVTGCDHDVAAVELVDFVEVVQEGLLDLADLGWGASPASAASASSSCSLAVVGYSIWARVIVVEVTPL